MTEQHPIIPPPELVEQWVTEVWHEGTPARLSLSDMHIMHIAAEAAIWAADQELEACVEWFDNQSLVYHRDLEYALRTARRPKPTSLKEQAILQLDTLNADLDMHGRGCDLSQIRRALEALDD